MSMPISLMLLRDHRRLLRDRFRFNRNRSCEWSGFFSLMKNASDSMLYKTERTKTSLSMSPSLLTRRISTGILFAPHVAYNLCKIKSIAFVRLNVYHMRCTRYVTEPSSFIAAVSNRWKATKVFKLLYAVETEKLTFVKNIFIFLIIQD
jgi:hypothetical protein